MYFEKENPQICLLIGLFIKARVTDTLTEKVKALAIIVFYGEVNAFGTQRQISLAY